MHARLVRWWARVKARVLISVRSVANSMGVSAFGSPQSWTSELLRMAMCEIVWK
jgi:hypothetical protein